MKRKRLTQADIREAFYKAADSVLNGSYSFWGVHVQQTSDNEPMCMWAWVGFHLGMHGKTCKEVAETLGFREGELYALGTALRLCHFNKDDAAVTLRIFAHEAYG